MASATTVTVAAGVGGYFVEAGLVGFGLVGLPLAAAAGIATGIIVYGTNYLIRSSFEGPDKAVIPLGI